MSSRLVRADGTVVCERCTIAERPLSRMRGLLGRRSLDEGEGMLIRRTSSIHTFFMQFAIDVVFLDRDGLVLRVAECVRPGRARMCRKAASALELPAGEAARRGLRAGVDRLQVVT